MSDLADDADAIPDTGGLRPAAPSELPGRLLAVEVRAHQTHREVLSLRRIGWAIVGLIAAELGAFIGGVFYLGGRMERIEALSERVEILEDRAWQARDRMHVDTRATSPEE